MNTLSEAVTAFLSHCEFERNFSPHTIKAYRLDLGQFRRFLEAKATAIATGPAAVTKPLLREYVRELSVQKPRTQRRKIAALKSLFGFLEREGVIEVNPVRSLRLNIRLGRTLPRTVSLSTLRSLFAKIYEPRETGARRQRLSARATRDIALFELMFASGMRVSELSHLLTETVDIQRGHVLIRGKGNKERQIPICDPEVCSALAAYSALRPASGDGIYFFANRFGRRLSEQSIRLALKRHAKAAGLERITPHVFRHTVATMLLEQGVDLRFIQTFLGHSSIVTTTIYAHVNDRSQREVLTQRHPRRLLGELSGTRGTPRTDG